MVGFAGAVGQTVPIGATYIYRVNFFAGFIVSSATYYLLNRIWPAKAVPDGWTENGDQDVMEARLPHSPDDYEPGQWKLNDGDNAPGFHDRKIATASESPTGSNF